MLIIRLFDSISDKQKQECTINDIFDFHTELQLASLKSYVFEGNKNEIGSLDGTNGNVRNQINLKEITQSCITAEVDNQVSTVDSNTVIDGNCYQNTLPYF